MDILGFSHLTDNQTTVKRVSGPWSPLWPRSFLASFLPNQVLYVTFFLSQIVPDCFRSCFKINKLKKIYSYKPCFKFPLMDFTQVLETFPGLLKKKEFIWWWEHKSKQSEYFCKLQISVRVLTLCLKIIIITNTETHFVSLVVTIMTLLL